MKSADHEEQEIRAALKQAFPETHQELRRDLWPVFAQRLKARKVIVPWYDWALAACLLVAVFAFPKIILLFAYQL